MNELNVNIMKAARVQEAGLCEKPGVTLIGGMDLAGVHYLLTGLNNQESSKVILLECGKQQVMGNGDHVYVMAEALGEDSRAKLKNALANQEVQPGQEPLITVMSFGWFMDYSIIRNVRRDEADVCEHLDFRYWNPTAGTGFSLNTVDAANPDLTEFSDLMKLVTISGDCNSMSTIYWEAMPKKVRRSVNVFFICKDRKYRSFWKNKYDTRARAEAAGMVV